MGRRDDLISRHAAIDAVLNSKHFHDIILVEPVYKDGFLLGQRIAKEDVLDDLEELPSAESQWIPCSERMPEEREWVGTKDFGTTISDEVYVTFESPKGERFCKHLSFQNGKVSRYDQMEIDAFHKGAVPIAWKPLPKPYKGDKE